MYLLIKGTFMSEVTGQRVEVYADHPFEIVDVPAEVLENESEEEIFERVVDHLRQTGKYKPGLVYSGFDGSTIRAGGFRDRDSTYGWTEATMEAAFRDGRGERTPVHYMTDEVATRPALGVFDPDKLKGGLTRHGLMLEPIAGEQLVVPDRTLIYWATRDGAPLDTATVAVFMFRTAANRNVQYVPGPTSTG